MKSYALQVFLLGFVLITSCNKDDYVGISTQVEGLDAQCSAGTDIPSCEAIQGCQVALEDVESVNPVFAACIANPPEEEIIDPTNGEEEQEEEENTPINPPVSNPGSGSEEEEEEDEEPTIDDALQARCEGLDEKYYYSKVYTGKGGSKRVKKVKVCHHSANDKHAIIVACPALKAHKKHDDYLGACRVE